MLIKHLAELLARRRNWSCDCYSFCIPSARPRDDVPLTERMKGLYKQGGVWDEFSAGFQSRVGNRSRVGLILCDYGIRPGHSCSPEPYSLPLLFEAWEGDEKRRVLKCSPWGRHRHTEPKTCEPLGPCLPMCPNPVLKHFLHSCPSLESSYVPSPTP